MNESRGQTVKSRGGLLTLKYLGASAAAVMSVLASLGLLSSLMMQWTGGAGLVWLVGNHYGMMVSLGVSAVVFALLAMWLYRLVSREVAARPAYLSSTPYVVITNIIFGFFAVLLVCMVIRLISVLLSSLLLIGSGADIGGMYLREFLPTLVGAALVFVAVWMTYKIVRGKNMSWALSLVLVSVAGALLLATLITVPLATHATDETDDVAPIPGYQYRGNQNTPWNRMLEDL